MGIENDTTGNEPMSIGEAAAEILEQMKLDTQERIKTAKLFRLLQRQENEKAAELMREIEKTRADVKRVADAWDREHNKRDKWSKSLIRGIKQFLAGVENE